ncbi:epidermal growth factor receptor substrate 15-like 1 isoform X4 [Tenebrio molitor]|uniref:epidermal growth factor receptor substrate 15-like 1 isoform X4 n=1 Tax=Tenebrio molitor TaxID=7067 RepID=UPI0036246E90
MLDSRRVFLLCVAGNHSAIYETYYNVVDPNGFGTVGGMEAARFLKRSGLSDVILSKIWDLSDPGGRGCLDKSGMFVALKLVALVQNGKDLTISNVNMDVPPPKMGDIPLPKPVKPPPPSNTPLITSLPPTAVDWTVKPSEREKYDKLFDSLQPTNGLIPGNKVKNVLLESKLPFETLGKIWDLADQDKDGMLDRHEFVAAMHLVYKALDKYAIPNTLPSELMPPAKTKNNPPMVTPLLSRGLDGVKPDIPPPPVTAPVVSAMKPVQTVQPTIPWVVTPDEKAKSDALFIKSDIDKDGFVSGQEIKNVFLQSGVPQHVLAHIWALCDIKQSGKLNNEQFALAMWFVARCLKGVEPPPTLTPDMVPPSFRSVKSADGLVENNNTRYSNPELDMISKDIEELAREKLALETDIAQKEADIKIKSGEIKSLQSELDTLAATLKQLENQKGEAQKRLNDLRAQKYEVDTEMEKIAKEIAEETAKVDKLRTQAAEQAEAVAAQESELNSKKEQLEGLRQEEQRLEQQKKESANKLQNLTTNLQDTQLNISQAKALITQLQEQTRQMNDAIEACDAAIETGDATCVIDTTLRIQPDFRDPEYTNVGLMNGNSNRQNGFGDDKDDPFSSKQNGPLNTSSGFGEDLFSNDTFKNADAFEESDPFNSAFSKSNNGFSSDPFGGSSFTPGSAPKSDPFDAFGDSRKSVDSTVEADKDPFGCDPFAVLHAPTRDGAPPARPTSPSPALPPKKSKQPPPRPAPPRPAQPPNVKRSSQTDLFSSGSDTFSPSGGGFADFSDFDSKLRPRYHHLLSRKSITTRSKNCFVLSGMVFFLLPIYSLFICCVHN